MLGTLISGKWAYELTKIIVSRKQAKLDVQKRHYLFMGASLFLILAFSMFLYFGFYSLDKYINSLPPYHSQLPKTASVEDQVLDALENDTSFKIASKAEHDVYGAFWVAVVLSWLTCGVYWVIKVIKPMGFSRKQIPDILFFIGISLYIIHSFTVQERALFGLAVIAMLVAARLFGFYAWAFNKAKGMPLNIRRTVLAIISWLSFVMIRTQSSYEVLGFYFHQWSTSSIGINSAIGILAIFCVFHFKRVKNYLKL